MKRLDLDFISSYSDKKELFSSLLDENEIHISISYSSDFKNAKLLRESVDIICQVFGISPKWRTRLVLIIDELNNNAIEYGSSQGDINEFEIRLYKGEDSKVELSASVTDSWKWTRAKSAQDMEEVRKNHENKDFSKHHSIRGRGLFLIISHLVDDLSFVDSTSGWLTVQVMKKLDWK